MEGPHRPDREKGLPTASGLLLPEPIYFWLVPRIVTVASHMQLFSFGAYLRVLVCLGLAVGADPVMGAQISLSDRLNLLKNSYPDDIAAVEGNKLVLKNGKSFLIDDGIKKTHQEKLKNADIEDMLSQIYPLGACFKGSISRNFDPGRIRNVSLMREIFGRSKQAVAKNLTSINWFGRSVRFTRVAGAGQALIRVRDELAKLAPKFRKYFEKSAGTFHWRVVAGTKRLSQHSFGAAIDINTKFGDYWRWSGGKPGKVPKFKNRIPMEIVEIFERHGFIWGGKWYHYDTMHFSYRPELIAIAELALQRGCAR